MQKIKLVVPWVFVKPPKNILSDVLSTAFYLIFNRIMNIVLWQNTGTGTESSADKRQLGYELTWLSQFGKVRSRAPGRAAEGRSQAPSRRQRPPPPPKTGLWSRRRTPPGFDWDWGRWGRRRIQAAAGHRQAAPGQVDLRLPKHKRCIFTINYNMSLTYLHSWPMTKQNYLLGLVHSNNCSETTSQKLNSIWLLVLVLQ